MTKQEEARKLLITGKELIEGIVNEGDSTSIVSEKVTDYICSHHQDKKDVLAIVMYMEYYFYEAGAKSTTPPVLERLRQILKEQSHGK